MAIGTTTTVNSPIIQSRRPSTGKRTNSLGWAHSDCHTCSSLNRLCDRRRPRCDACTADGVICGGYVQQLNWQRGVASRGKLKGRKLSVDRPSPPEAEVNKPTAFTFVQELGTESKPRVKRRKSKGDDFTPISEHNPKPIEETTPILALCRYGDSPSPDQRPSQSRSESETVDLMLCRPMYNFFNLPSPMMDMLSFYEWRFSMTTLTFSVRVNPWQSCLTMVFDTPCLMDAIQALARRHRAHLLSHTEDLQVLELKDRALSSFALGLDKAPCDAMISTTLALMGLEYAETGFSNWSVYLYGALRLLESRGGIKLAKHSSMLRSQIAMLAWYDMTGALLSRRGPIFPRSYVTSLMKWRLQDEWSIFSLNGCPDSLFVDIYDICVAAVNPEAVSADDAALLEMRVWNARNESSDQSTLECTPSDLILSSDPQYDPVQVTSEHVAGLFDSWRLSLLLYISRIFHSAADNDENSARKTLAEEILCLVSAMPSSSDVQKQCLLPVVLAGFEVRTSKLRHIAEDFCERWSHTTGLWVFSSALQLLHQVWKEVDATAQSKIDSDPDVWWGDIIGRDGIETYLFG